MIPSVRNGINISNLLLHEDGVKLSLVEIFSPSERLERETMVKTEGRLIGSVDFKITCPNVMGIAKIDIELHQRLAETPLSIMWMHNNIEKFRFFCHIPKADKTDKRRF